MITWTLPDRAAVLAAVDHHPYSRFAAGTGFDLVGLAADGAALWWADSLLGRIGHALGDHATIAALLQRAADQLDGVRWVNLPRQQAPVGWRHNEDWDLRWLTGPLPQSPGEPDVGPVTDDSAINDLLDAAMPDSMLRPRSPLVHGWYGVWRHGQLVACAADRSTRSTAADATPVGVLGGIAVHPDHRGQGLGAAVTAYLSRQLQERYELVTLGVVADNETASRLYARLGFTGVHEITSVRPAS